MPRLDPEHVARIDQESQTLTGLQQALALAAEGWHVFPIRPGTKVPLFPNPHKNEARKSRCRGECGQIGHGAWDGTTDADTIRKWWGQHPSAGIGANLGDDRIAFDVDLNHGGRYLTSFPHTRKHLSGRQNGNGHLIYKYDPATAAASIQSGNGALGDGMDIKTGRGSYIIMPGTRHEETGKLYTVAPDNAGAEHLLQDDEVAAIFAEAGIALGPEARAASKGMQVIPGGKSKPTAKETTRALGTLTDLLQHPPAEGGRNDWLTKVCGHLAKMHRDKRDLYDLLVSDANAKLPEPLDQAEVDKTADSIWVSENENHPERFASADSGFLVSNGRGRLLCRAMVKSGDDSVEGTADYADFDIEARGVAVAEDGHRSYWLRLIWKKQQIDLAIAGDVLGDDRATRRWLASFGATYSEPFNASPKMSVGVRVQRYIESQNPPEVKISPTLGWSDDVQAFVTHEGIILPSGPASKEDSGIVADPRLLERDVAPFYYGFEHDESTALEVLREVLTYQDEETVSVFGAWWAACLLKPQIQTQTSLFPFFGVEAASESGKTNGFFSLMVALNGNHRGQIAPTRPVLRDSASANRNGIVWADDLDDLSPYGEILRASTSNGTASKMDMDRNGIKNTQIVAPILISGEQLGMGTQKALADRAVIISVASPTGRLSTRNKGQSQWHDVVELMQRFPGQLGLSVLAGWFQSLALQRVDETLAALRTAKKEGKGRHGDKVAVLMAGAQLLDSLLGHGGAWRGDGEHAQRVAKWAKAHEGLMTADNTLTMEVIPWALRQFSGLSAPQVHMGRFDGMVTPVFVKDNGAPDLEQAGGREVWISSSVLSDVWNREHNHRVDARTATKTALSQQADRVTVDGSSKSFKITGTSKVARYRRLTPEYAKLVLERAESD